MPITFQLPKHFLTDELARFASSNSVEVFSWTMPSTALLLIQLHMLHHFLNLLGWNSRCPSSYQNKLHSSHINKAIPLLAFVQWKFRYKLLFFRSTIAIVFVIVMLCHAMLSRDLTEYYVCRNNLIFSNQPNFENYRRNWKWDDTVEQKFYEISRNSKIDRESLKILWRNGVILWLWSPNSLVEWDRNLVGPHHLSVMTWGRGLD